MSTPCLLCRCVELQPLPPLPSPLLGPADAADCRELEAPVLEHEGTNVFARMWRYGRWIPTAPEVLRSSEARLFQCTPLHTPQLLLFSRINLLPYILHIRESKSSSSSPSSRLSQALLVGSPTPATASFGKPTPSPTLLSTPFSTENGAVCFRSSHSHLVLPIPFERQEIEIHDGHKINTVVMGRGPPIVLIHGFGAGIGYFVRLLSSPFFVSLLCFPSYDLLRFPTCPSSPRCTPSTPSTSSALVAALTPSLTVRSSSPSARRLTCSR